MASKAFLIEGSLEMITLICFRIKLIINTSLYYIYTKTISYKIKIKHYVHQVEDKELKYYFYQVIFL